MEKLEHLKASVRAKVEHPFHIVKHLFRHRKARYRGLAKDLLRLTYAAQNTYAAMAAAFVDLLERELIRLSERG